MTLANFIIPMPHHSFFSNILEWTWHYAFVGFFKALWQLIKSMMTAKGLIAFGISFLLFVGWAWVFVIYGLIVGNYWLVGIGTSIITFWTLPLTPMWTLIISFAYFLQVIVFRDKKALTKKELLACFTQQKIKFEYVYLY